MSGVKTWEVWRRGRAAAVLPYDPVADAVVLIEQFRLPALVAGLDPVLVELPAGLCDDGETPEATARREMMEEMGLAVGALRRIGGFLLTPGGADEVCELYAGRVQRAGRRCRRHRRPCRHGGGARGHPRAGLARGPRDRGGAGRADDQFGDDDRPAVARGAARGAAEGMDGGMTEKLFLDDPRLRSATGTVLASGPEGIVLDRTVFYARSGGQPGDVGVLRWEGGETAIADTVKGEGETILHLPAPGAALPPVGATVEGEIDWDRRYRLMRMHTAMHLLCSLIKGAAVTGGSVGADRSRLDFDLPNPPPKEEIEAGLNALIEADHPVRIEWVDEAVLDADPGLVRTMSVAPPRGTGRLRLMRIGEGDALVDLQPCGGTHVARTGEIGRIAVVKIENKGRQNRRIIIAPAG